MDAKILLFDIEVLPGIVGAWGIHKQYHTIDDIIKEPSLICVAWEWYKEDTGIESFSILEDRKRFNKDPHDDIAVVRKLHKLLTEADIVAGHNVHKFDFNFVNGRFIHHGLPPVPQPRFIDTYKIAQSRFRLPSYKLEYLCRIFGIKHTKLEMTKRDWMNIITGPSRVKAVKKMVDYNEHDVWLSQQVMERLLPHSLPNHSPNANVYSKDDGVHRCRNVTCASDNLKLKGTRSTNAGLYQRYQCRDCKTWGQYPSNLLVHRPVAR